MRRSLALVASSAALFVACGNGGEEEASLLEVLESKQISVPANVADELEDQAPAICAAMDVQAGRNVGVAQRTVAEQPKNSAAIEQFYAGLSDGQNRQVVVTISEFYCPKNIEMAKSLQPR